MYKIMALILYTMLTKHERTESLHIITIQAIKDGANVIQCSSVFTF